MPLLILLFSRPLRWCSAAAIALLTAACFQIVSTQVQAIKPGSVVLVQTPVKAHLADGSTVVYEHGVLVRPDSLIGAGFRYNLALTEGTPVAAIPIAAVVGMESFTRRTNAAGSVALSLLATAVSVVGLTALAVAIFGSCPTFYSDSAGVARLEAEGFSYSIAPLFEARDVDRLRAMPDSAGIVRLEVRNEAAETHFLNQLELLDVEREPDEFVVPDPTGGPLAVAGLRAPLSVSDGVGRNVAPLLAAADGLLFASDPKLVAVAGSGRLHDTLFVTLPPVATDSAALVLRLRNSLLTTVLLYDVMLRPQGAGAIDWLGAGLADLGSAIDLGRWYQRDMGLHIQVETGGRWRETGWVRDVGPIAFEDIGVVVPVTRGVSTKVRLVFPIDGWRIDRLQVGGTMRRPVARRVPMLAAHGPKGETLEAAIGLLRDPDERYLETGPGQSFTAAFAVGTGSPDRHTLMLVSQGYYTEWLRPSWLQPQANQSPAGPDSTSLAKALGRWRTVRDSFESRFVATKFPVR